MEQNVADAAYSNDWEKVRRLVEQGENVNDVSRMAKKTALHFAAAYVNAASCLFLLSRGANVRQTDENGDTPLHLAAYSDPTVEICQLLVDHNADVSSVNNEGQNPLHVALNRWFDSLTAYRPLITNENVNVADAHGNRALHIAARKGHIQTVQLLVDCGADVNVLNEDGQTPLHTAAGGEYDRPELCSVLLEHNTKIDAVDKDGNQPLHLALRRQHTRTSCLLLSNRADVNALNGDGQTPLHTAAGGKQDCPELCSNLLEHNAKIDAVDKDGNQPLHLACRLRHAATGNLLLSHGADVTGVNNQQRKPLHLANESILKWYASVCDDDNALHIAARNGHIQTVQLLVDCGADVNALNEDGQTPLHTAAGGWKDCPELCSILLEHDAKIDAVDKDGKQALHLACQCSHLATANLLMSYGADVTVLDKQQRESIRLANEPIFKSGQEQNDKRLSDKTLDVAIVTTVPIELQAVKKVLEKAGCPSFSDFQIRGTSDVVKVGGMSTKLQLQTSTYDVGVFCLFQTGHRQVTNFLRAVKYGVETKQVSRSGLLVMVGACAGFFDKVGIGTIMAPSIILAEGGNQDAETSESAAEAAYAEVRLDVQNGVQAASPYFCGYGWLDEYLPDEMKGTPSPPFLQDAILAELKKVQHEAMTVAQLHTALSSAHERWPTKATITRGVVKKALCILRDPKRGHVSQDGPKYSITEEGIRFIDEIESDSDFPRSDRSNPEVSHNTIMAGDLVFVGMACEQQAKLKADVHEMEGYGFLRHVQDHLMALNTCFVKTVTDYADEQSTTDYYQEYGTCLAAAFFLHVLKKNPALAAKK